MMHFDSQYIADNNTFSYCFSFDAYSKVGVYIDNGMNELWAKVDGQLIRFSELSWKYKAPMFFEIQGNKTAVEALQCVSASKAVELYIKAIYIYQNPSFLN